MNTILKAFSSGELKMETNVLQSVSKIDKYRQFIEKMNILVMSGQLMPQCHLGINHCHGEVSCSRTQLGII